jgi:hypothetical protein
MSQSCVAVGRTLLVKSQALRPERAGPGPGGLPSWGNRSKGRDRCGEPDHLPAMLCRCWAQV